MSPWQVVGPITGTIILVPYLWVKSLQLSPIFNSLDPGKFEWNLRHIIFKQILVIDGWGISCEIVLIWMSLDFADGQSTLVWVMAWCHQATSHCLGQCWPRSLSPYGVTRPQWVKSSHCYSFENWAPVDEIYGWLIFRWVVTIQLPKPKIYLPWRTQHENIPNTHVSAYCR